MFELMEIWKGRNSGRTARYERCLPAIGPLAQNTAAIPILFSKRLVVIAPGSHRQCNILGLPENQLLYMVFLP